jgi:hypothetical protein
LKFETGRRGGRGKWRERERERVLGGKKEKLEKVIDFWKIRGKQLLLVEV